MKSILGIAILSLAALFTAPAMARSSVPVVNYDNVAVTTGSGIQATAEQVRQAIIKGGTSKGWTFTQTADGKLLANLIVRNKHTVEANITHAADKYSVTYQSSINMNFEMKDGQPVIHPHYNKWVQNLLTEVNRELAKL